MSIPTILDNVTPSDLDLPSKFPAFRQAQREIVDFALYGPEEDGGKKVAATGAPPGSGKTLASEAIGKVSGRRIVTLTATRSLQDQRRDDFVVADVRGKNNHDCREVEVEDRAGNKRGVKCDVGMDNECSLEGSLDCPYFASIDYANDQPSVSTNYAWWMNARGMNQQALERGGRVRLLIADEAHLAPDELCRYLNTYLSLDDIFAYSGLKGGAQVPWKGAVKEHGRVDETWMQMFITMYNSATAARYDRLDLYDGNVRAARRDRKFRQLDKLLRELQKITRHGADGNWIWQLRGKGVEFDIVWPYRYAERYLFSGVEKVVLMSATLRPKLLSLLGLKRGEVDFKEWPRQFPAERAPVYYLPTMKDGKVVRMNWRTAQEDIGLLAQTVDALIEARPLRKSLIHTHSYKRAKMLQARSKYGRYMILNEQQGAGEWNGAGQGLTAQQAAEKYRKAVPTPDHPAMLVGPSFTTGWDFPLDQCELNIILKIPWPDLSSPIMEARAEDEQYAPYITMQDLVQACGRPQRSEVDRAETFLLDGGIENFQYYAKQHAPQWFRVNRIEGIPKEPVKL